MPAFNPSLDSMPQLALFDSGAKVHGDVDVDADALGDAYCRANDAQSRRAQGITLTPAWLVERMLDEVAGDGFDTIVDCGAGTGRFALAAARRFPAARVIVVEQNREVASLLRQRLWECGLLGRVAIIEGDFRSVAIPTSGRTLFLGNPPYVRHHASTRLGRRGTRSAWRGSESRPRNLRGCMFTSCCAPPS